MKTPAIQMMSIYISVQNSDWIEASSESVHLGLVCILVTPDAEKPPRAAAKHPSSSHYNSLDLWLRFKLLGLSHSLEAFFPVSRQISFHSDKRLLVCLCFSTTTVQHVQQYDTFIHMAT